MARIYLASILVSSMAHRFNLSVHAVVHWKEGNILSVSTAASIGENVPRKYPSKQYGLSIQPICTYCGLLERERYSICEYCCF